MSKNKCRVAVLKEHFLLLCHMDAEKALLLDRILFYASAQTDLVELLEEEVGLGTLTLPADVLEKLRGWVKKSAAQLADSILMGSSPRTVSRKLTEMVAAGLLLTHPDQAEGTPLALRPNLVVIKKSLATLGYTLEGYIIRELVEGVETEYTNPPTPEAEKSRDAQWEDLAAASTYPKASAKPNPKAEEEILWLQKQKRLDHAPPHIRHFSWLVYDVSGFLPDTKTWVAEVSALYEACGGNEALLLAGLHAGEEARRDKKHPITMSGPRSYLNYIKNVAALKRKPVTTADKLVRKQRVSAEETDPNEEAPKLNGQRIATTKAGKPILQMGKKRLAA